MNVRKGVPAPWKGRLIYPKRLRALFFSIPSSSQASTPFLRGPANDLHNAIAKRSCFKNVQNMLSSVDYLVRRLDRPIWKKSNFKGMAP